MIRDSALAHNHAWMRDFTAATGVLLAPHGKTTMAPQLFAQQLEAGAWGMTVANVQQLGICARFGVRRVLMANQLLGALEVAHGDRAAARGTRTSSSTSWSIRWRSSRRSKPRRGERPAAAQARPR